MFGSIASKAYGNIMNFEDKLLCLFYKKTNRNKFMCFYSDEYVKTLPENTRSLALKCLNRIKDIHGGSNVILKHYDIIHNIIGKDLSITEDIVDHIWYEGFGYDPNYIYLKITPEYNDIYVYFTKHYALNVPTISIKQNDSWPIINFPNIGAAYNYIKYGQSGISDITSKISKFKKASLNKSR